MSDAAANEAPRSSRTVEALKLMAAAPRRRTGASTETIVTFASPLGVSQLTGTSLVDVRALAETVMFDATVLVSRLDQLDAAEGEVQREVPDNVSVSKVLEGGAAVTGAFALVCIVGNQLTNDVFLHPLIAWSMILMSIGFFAMGRVRP